MRKNVSYTRKIKTKEGIFMEMTAINRDGKMIVLLNGEIDHHSAKELRDGIDRLIVETRPKTLVLDLSGIDFMDSSGLGLVLGRYRRIKEINAEMYLCNVGVRVKKILSMAGVDRLIRIVPSDAHKAK